MPAIARTLFRWLATSTLARGEEREFARKFAFQPGCVLKIDSDPDRLTIDESDGSEVAVSLVMEAVADMAQAVDKFFWRAVARPSRRKKHDRDPGTQSTSWDDG